MPGAKAVRHSISTNRRIESLTVTFDIMSHPFDDSCEEGTLATFISVMSASTAFPHCCSLHFATCYPCCLKTFIYQGACMLHKCTAPLALPFHEVLYDLSRRILLPSKTTPVIISAWLDDSMCRCALHTLGLREGWPVYVCDTEDQQPPSRTNHGIERVQGISAFSHSDSLVLWGCFIKSPKDYLANKFAEAAKAKAKGMLQEATRVNCTTAPGCEFTHSTRF